MKKQAKKKILEFLHFWPTTIVIHILLLLILSPGLAGANEKYLDPDYTEGQQEIIKWPEKTGDLKKIETVGIQTLKPYSMMWSTDVVRTGDYSLRLEYRDNDCGKEDCTRGSFKGQFGRTEAFWIANNRIESWSRFSVFIPKDTMHLDKGYTMFTQWETHFSQNVNGCPQIPLHFMLSNQGIEIHKEPGDKACTITRNLMITNNENFKGKWLDFVVHAKWSNKDDGFIHVWVNGIKEHEYHGMTLYNVVKEKLPNQRHNIYTGYKLEGHKQTQVIYFDAFYSAKNCKSLKLETLGYSCNTLTQKVIGSDNSEQGRRDRIIKTLIKRITKGISQYTSANADDIKNWVTQEIDQLDWDRDLDRSPDRKKLRNKLTELGINKFK